MNNIFESIQPSAEARICDLHRDAALARAVKRTWAMTRLLPRQTWQFRLLGELTLKPQRSR
jgi:hypothetical protein